jgi:hypothetical protein
MQGINKLIMNGDVLWNGNCVTVWMDMHFLLSQVLLCVCVCVKRGWEHCWKELWIRGNDGEVSSYCSWQWYHHYVQWTEQCGELALWQHSVNIILINCLWWHDSPVKSTQLVDYVVRSECKLFFICIYFAESKECEEWDIANCVFVI